METNHERTDITELPALNIHKLSDGDLVIYHDGDVEFKHRSMSPYGSARLVPMGDTNRVPLDELETMTHAHGGYRCYIVKDGYEKHSKRNNK